MANINPELTTPVLFLVFNRPELTAKVFNEIKKAKPKRLFIAADGSRPGVKGEKEKIDRVKEIVSHVDWACEVKTLFREKNAGCKIAVSSAINWFFEQVEEGIILEDDCLPSNSFFFFCQELLERYRKDERIMQITGSNYGYVDPAFPYDYFFTKYAVIWGWATWKSAWSKMDLDLPYLEECITLSFLDTVYFSKGEILKSINDFKKYKKGRIDTWDYPWNFSMITHNGLAVVPRLNLITNIGFDGDSTHTGNIRDPRIKSILSDFSSWPLNHPSYCVKNSHFDHLVSRQRRASKWQCIIQRIMHWIPFSKC
ncbi:MAG: hypothetical protein ABIJ41_03565 [Candidatus Omnitrophota bacterium]